MKEQLEKYAREISRSCLCEVQINLFVLLCKNKQVKSEKDIDKILLLFRKPREKKEKEIFSLNKLIKE